MKNLPLLIGTILGTIALVVAISLIFSGEKEVRVVDENILLEGATNVQGPDDARVTIVEFSDFQCPACLAAETHVVQVLAAYPDDVRLIYRHFPLENIHPFARLAAQASEVAAGENKFWEMHELLFADQHIWSQLESDEEVTEHFATLAEKLEIDKSAFLETIRESQINEKVTADLAVGGGVQVNSTPTFFINGQQTTAPQLLPTVESLLTE